MSLEKTIATLQAHPLFAGLDPEALRILAFSSDRMEVPPGTRVFVQGAPADSGYVLLAGRLDLEQTREGRVVTLGAVPEGALLGELALITQTNRPATAITRTAAEILKVPRTVFRRILEEYPRGAEDLRRKLGARLITLAGELDKVRGALLVGLPDVSLPEDADDETAPG